MNKYILIESEKNKNEMFIAKNTFTWTSSQALEFPNMVGDKVIRTTNRELKLKGNCNCSKSEAIECSGDNGVGKCQQVLPPITADAIQTYIKEYNTPELVNVGKTFDDYITTLEEAITATDKLKGTQYFDVCRLQLSLIEERIKQERIKLGNEHFQFNLRMSKTK